MQSRTSSTSVPLIPMRPSNERELAIARTVDKIAIEGRLHQASIGEVVAALGFPVIHRSDSAYLERYIQWRMANPMVK
jgi:hypothetical protein